MTLIKIFENIKQQYAFLWQKPMLVSVSGGVDSVVLLHLLIQHECTPIVFHCNFKLRGEDSDQDEQFVRNLCNKLGLTFHIEHFDTLEYASKHSMSLQMSARALRLQKTYECIEKYNCECAVLSHHLNDNIETILLTLLRGTGFKGLKGMEIYANRIFRPLLQVPKAQIIEYAKINNIDYREDISNKNTKYKRNVIRNEIIPVIMKYYPNFEKIMSSNIMRFNEQWKILEKIFSELENKITKQYSFYTEYDLNKLEIDQLTTSSLMLLIEKYGFNFQQIASMINNLKETETTIYNTNNYTACLKSGLLEIISNSFSFSQLPIYELKCVNDFFIEPINQFFSAQIITSKKFDAKILTNREVFLDLKKLQFPLFIRPWKDEDVINPLGMKGKKTVRKFLKDLKLPHLRMKSTYVLASNNTVIWIIGFRISQQFAINNNTEKVLWLRFERDIIQ